MSTDSSYFREENVAYLVQEQIDGYVATGRIKHGDQPWNPFIPIIEESFYAKQNKKDQSARCSDEAGRHRG
jgi:hypothetical protein